jgi:para-nitrobenzyl esterase
MIAVDGGRRAALVAIASLTALVGPVRGTDLDHVSIDTGVLIGASDAVVRTFKGVPYAAAPVGAQRWRPPRPALRWTQPRQATEYGPACPQFAPPGVTDILRYGAAPEPTSEDCLTLNVWAPKGAANAPVMVWIHGGAGRMGAGSLPYYDGTSFARDGVVLVTVNYRLGHLGSFAHPALTRAAAAGEPLVSYSLMDQIAALEWVRRNIAAFGGNPRNVTLFGESAGALDTLVLMTTPRALPLFHKAIVESGGGWFPPSYRKDAEKCGVEMATKAGLPGAALAVDRQAEIIGPDLQQHGRRPPPRRGADGRVRGGAGGGHPPHHRRQQRRGFVARPRRRRSPRQGHPAVDAGGCQKSLRRAHQRR